jgi:hypothetical protein
MLGKQTKILSEDNIRDLLAPYGNRTRVESAEARARREQLTLPTALLIEAMRTTPDPIQSINRFYSFGKFGGHKDSNLGPAD